ncbi:hypothetical protein HDU93_003544 [Gonapodya sp. JEL0774]|nr:hypothetical protein HDU93_003544 [Gonapodya sp. JEL0774]
MHSLPLITSVAVSKRVRPEAVAPPAVVGVNVPMVGVLSTDPDPTTLVDNAVTVRTRDVWDVAMPVATTLSVFPWARLAERETRTGGRDVADEDAVGRDDVED